MPEISLPLSRETILAYMIDAGRILDAQDVPTENRCLILPDWCAKLMAEDMARHIDQVILEELRREPYTFYLRRKIIKI